MISIPILHNQNLITIKFFGSIIYQHKSLGIMKLGSQYEKF